MSNENMLGLSSDEQDAIAEVMNISMGSSATALSTMLSRQVDISTPQIENDVFSAIDISDLEPAVMVKIRYVEGLDGCNVVMFRKGDMQCIIDILMGNDDPTPEDEFEFDEMTMSAACEVMNQMMGASATALSEMLETVVNISTPEAMYVESRAGLTEDDFEIAANESVVALSFQLSIKDALQTTFVSLMTETLAKTIVDQLQKGMNAPDEVAAPEPVAAPEAAAPVPPPPPPPVPPADAGAVPPPMAPPPMAGDPAAGYPPPYPPNYGYPPPGYPPAGYPQPTHPVQQASFPDFAGQGQRVFQSPELNMNLLMGVKLDVTVVVGRAKKKIKDIMDFGQGTVIPLDTLTGAPAEIMVNGHLLAYGDIIVVGDNFGVRITEIVGTKQLFNALSQG